MAPVVWGHGGAMWRHGAVRDPAVVVRYSLAPSWTPQPGRSEAAWTWALVVTAEAARDRPGAVPRVGLVRPFAWPSAPVPTVRDAVRELLREAAP